MRNFCSAKVPQIFYQQKKVVAFLVGYVVNFNISLSNDIVRFQQLGPDLQKAAEFCHYSRSSCPEASSLVLLYFPNL